MNKEKAVTILSYVIIIAVFSVLFFAGLTIGIVIGGNNKPQTTWSLDSNSIQFKRSIQVDGNLYVKGKIYQYKEK